MRCFKKKFFLLHFKSFILYPYTNNIDIKLVNLHIYLGVIRGNRSSNFFLFLFI